MPPGFPHREVSPASVPAVEARMEQDQVAGLLEVFEGGDRDALDRLLPLVYDELRRIAHRQLGASAATTRSAPPSSSTRRTSSSSSTSA